MGEGYGYRECDAGHPKCAQVYLTTEDGREGPSRHAHVQKRAQIDKAKTLEDALVAVKELIAHG